MSPKEMLDTQRGWETHEDTFTIGKDKQGEDLRLVTYNLTDANLDKSGKTRAGLQVGCICCLYHNCSNRRAELELADEGIGRCQATLASVPCDLDRS